MVSFKTQAILSMLATSQAVNAHTWVEFVKRINGDGSFSGETGFPLPYIDRRTFVSGGGEDERLINRIFDGRGDAPVLRSLDGHTGYTSEYPRLTASAGDYLALLYEENGHVTNPIETPNEIYRPFRSGNVYVYGTLANVAGIPIKDVLYSWNEDGNGGNGMGQLLGAHHYDDGQCFQARAEEVSDANIWTSRTQTYKIPSLHCQTALRLPDNLPSEGIYTLIWVWDWAKLEGEKAGPNLGQFKEDEIYTSVAEIQLNPRTDGTSPVINYVGPTDVRNSTIKSQIDNMIEFTERGVGLSPPLAARGVSASEHRAAKTTFKTMIRSATAPPVSQPTEHSTF
ncbi:hypothetical protein HJFPF1_13150 [Paramyrothecium foliicola]|nr:hypothetical protein HJFPF1_13150 [Paramyrothecium foliicola]